MPSFLSIYHWMVSRETEWDNWCCPDYCAHFFAGPPPQPTHHQHLYVVGPLLPVESLRDTSYWVFCCTRHLNEPPSAGPCSEMPRKKRSSVTQPGVGAGQDCQQTIAGEGVLLESPLNINAGGRLAVVGAHGEVSAVIWLTPIVQDPREKVQQKAYLASLCKLAFSRFFT